MFDGEDKGFSAAEWLRTRWEGASRQMTFHPAVRKDGPLTVTTALFAIKRMYRVSFVFSFILHRRSSAGLACKLCRRPRGVYRPGSGADTPGICIGLERAAGLITGS
nr:hypothetical protein CFP56_29960 [Quercus suber]